MTSNKSATVLLGGGLDSAACAHFLSKTFEVTCLHIDYGQMAATAEFAAAERVAHALQLKVTQIRIALGRKFGAGEIVGRNGLLIFMALLACQTEAELLALGIHAGTTYFDCSPTFLDQVDRLVADQTDGRVRVIAPFVDWTKQQVFDYFRQTGIPPAVTYSCEAGVTPACGGCLSCLDRRALNI